MIIQLIKKTYSFFILSKRKLFFTLRRLINKKDIWSVYNFKNYNEYLSLQKAKTLNHTKRSLWLKEEWNSKLEYFEICIKLLYKFKTFWTTSGSNKYP